MKRFVYLAVIAAALSFVACERTEPEVPFGSKSTLSLPISNVSIPLQTFDTKSYLVDSGDDWIFEWEDGDVINYIVTRNGTVTQTGSGEVDKHIDYQNFKFDFAQPLEVGDIIYTYYNGKKSDVSDPTNVQMYIPSAQDTDFGFETYTDLTHVSDTLTEVHSGRLSFTKVNIDKTKASDANSCTPPSRTVSFSVKDYNPALNYTYSFDGRNYTDLAFTEDGTASVTYSFKSINFNNIISNLLSWFGIGCGGSVGYCTRTMYLKCESGKAASLSISVVGARTSNRTKNKNGRYTTTYSYDYLYSALCATSGSYNHEVITIIDELQENVTYGTTKVIPLRGCMPFAGDPITVTKSLLNGTKTFDDALTMRMVGSLIEFRLYSLDNSIAVGETIESVTFEADGPIAGPVTYDLTSFSSELTGASLPTIKSTIGNLGITIPYGSDKAIPVYLALAPGTVSGVYDIKTDAHHYRYSFTTPKTYSKNMRKRTTTNLASGSFEIY